MNKTHTHALDATTTNSKPLMCDFATFHENGTFDRNPRSCAKANRNSKLQTTTRDRRKQTKSKHHEQNQQCHPGLDWRPRLTTTNQHGRINNDGILMPDPTFMEFRPPNRHPQNQQRPRQQRWDSQRGKQQWKNSVGPNQQNQTSWCLKPQPRTPDPRAWRIPQWRDRTTNHEIDNGRNSQSRNRNPCQTPARPTNIKTWSGTNVTSYLRHIRPFGARPFSAVRVVMRHMKVARTITAFSCDNFW